MITGRNKITENNKLYFISFDNDLTSEVLKNHFVFVKHTEFNTFIQNI